MTYWKRIITVWNVCRIVRIAAGLPMMIYGITIMQWPVIIFGGAWLAAGVFSLQCCADGNCYTSYKANNRENIDETEFEEIK